MKRIIIFSILICLVIAVRAQLTVNSSGNVTASKNLTAAKISSKEFTSTLYSTDTLAAAYSITRLSSTTKDHPMGIKAFTFGGLKSIGICGLGQCYSSTDKSIGVLGMATNGKCAGIYGTTYSTDYGTYVDAVYAGFFRGNVKVTGTLNVNGTILSPSATSQTNSTVVNRTSNAQDFVQMLSSLDLNSYYVDQREESATEKASIDMSLLDANEQAAIADMSKDAPDNNSRSDIQLGVKQHYGLDAEQLEEVLPELVYENPDGSKSINYVEMVPILVQAINELKSEISELRGQEVRPATRASGSSTDSTDSVILLSLGENKPNPFSNTTTIPVSIPESVERAFIYVYDLTGKKVQQVDIAVRGKKSVTLDSSNLTDGMYLYSLIADGKVVQTRRMIVEKYN